jgi:phosphoribosyl 1,2-cyclic phosphate phosphodiesterase
MIACGCEVCRSSDARDKRLRTSALIQIDAEGATETKDLVENRETINLVIDAGPDFRTQILATGITRLDAILLTHEHKDHTGGIDDVRAFNYFEHRPTEMFATERVEQAVRRDYAYAFDEHPYPGAPEIVFTTIADAPFTVVQKSDGPAPGWMPADLVTPPRIIPQPPLRVEVIPIHGRHMNQPVTGFRIGPMAYLTDFNHIDVAEIEKLKGVELLVINALGHRKHPSHFNLEEAIEVSRRVGARHTCLTHMSHRMGRHADVSPTLPAGVYLAYDGLTVENREK